ncbi:MAG: 16S rRNA (cytidine1402-2'-O)-methyltransferase [Spirosomataceae bacterium]|jgi:16S rRNA (cytidine1402-2'-O)-methyltransferase
MKFPHYLFNAIFLMDSSSNPPKIYLIPTVLAPDTQLLTLSPQVLEIIPKLKKFYVEDIRTARRFISSLKLGIDIPSLVFFELNKKTPEEKVFKQMNREKQSIGVMSEAGCPGVADPGATAVKIAHRLGWKVVPIVGPNSMLLALMASGFSGQSYAFNGYLPIEKDKRVTEIKRLEELALTKRQTQLFMETPYRNNQVMESLLQHCNPDTSLCVAMNITSDDEFIKTKTVAEWQLDLPDLHKKPTIFLIGDVRNNS